MIPDRHNPTDSVLQTKKKMDIVNHQINVITMWHQFGLVRVRTQIAEKTNV